MRMPHLATTTASLSLALPLSPSFSFPTRYNTTTTRPFSTPLSFTPIHTPTHIRFLPFDFLYRFLPARIHKRLVHVRISSQLQSLYFFCRRRFLFHVLYPWPFISNFSDYSIVRGEGRSELFASNAGNPLYLSISSALGFSTYICITELH